MNAIAEIASQDPKNKTDAGNNQENKDKPVDNIEIHTETDEPPVKAKKAVNKFSKIDSEERTQRVEVLDPIVKTHPHKGKSFSHEDETTEINKDVVITGKPKLRGNVVIDTAIRYKHPHKTHKENNANIEKVSGYDIDDVSSMKTHFTPNHVGAKMPANPSQPKAYQDYAEAHKVLSKNIEKLKSVLKAIEDGPPTNRVNQQGIEMVKKNDGKLGPKQPSNNSAVTTVLQMSGTPVGPSNPPSKRPADYHVLQSQSTTQTNVTRLPGPPNAQQLRPLQDTATNQSQLPYTSGVLLKAPPRPVSDVASPGLHVIQGNENAPNDVSTQDSADVVDHIAHELVGHGSFSQSNVHGSNHLKNMLHSHNKTLQETFKELTPDNTKICKLDYIELCLIECRKTKTKLITLANHNRRIQ